MVYLARWRRLDLTGALAAIAIACILAPRLSATSVLPLTFDDLVTRATTIVRCDVVDVRAEWRERRDDRAIVTVVTIRVQSVLKGSSGNMVRLDFLGGAVDDTSLRVAGMPSFAVGDQAFLFIDGTGAALSPLVGFGLGRFAIQHDAFTQRAFVTNFDGRAFRGPTDFGRATRARAQTGFPPTRLEVEPAAALSDRDFETLIRQKVRDLPARH